MAVIKKSLVNKSGSAKSTPTKSDAKMTGKVSAGKVATAAMRTLTAKPAVTTAKPAVTTAKAMLTTRTTKVGY